MTGNYYSVWHDFCPSEAKTRQTSMYNKYFGFIESPFSITPDPRFFYANALYQEVLAILHYGIEAKKGFIVITGEVGTGKTTLLRKLMRNLESTIHSVFIFNTHLDFSGLLRLISRDLELAPQGKDRLMMIEELNGYLIEQLDKGHIVALLIDEAQNLSDEALEGLRLLSNLETDKEKLLQIVLMGQPELEVKLARPRLRQLKQRVALQCRLAPLDAGEVGAYIDFRLKEAGYTGEDLFDSDAVDQIALYSKGFPRLINIICDNALLNAYGTSRRKVTKETINEVASDLRLEAQTEVISVNVPALQVPATNARQEARPAVPANGLQSPSSRRARVWIANLSALLLLVIGAALFQSMLPSLKNFLGYRSERPGSEARLQMSSSRPADAIEKPKAATKEVPPIGEPREVNIVPERNPSPTSPRTAAGEEYTIKANDTLVKLAERYYAAPWRWIEIYAANRESIKNPDYIYIGQKIIIPAVTESTVLATDPDY
jgi:type II secretory pathway predicted ATPase ExeA/LysM repeat protein